MAEARASSRRAALVTGSGKGIGRGIALALARAGYDVAIHYRSSRDEAEAVRLEAESLGARAVTLQADVTNPLEAGKLIQGALETFGRLDVLVNNVGNYVRKPLLDLEIEEWHDMIDSNLNATFYTCRAAIPAMRQAGYGRIINIGYAGARNLLARPGIVPYAIAKTGVELLTKAIAKSEIAHGITANIVAPGVIENSVTRPVTEIPAGRLGRIDEVTGAVLYFVSPEAEYVTGQTLEISGGWNL
jgi:NAD(P)-dependent dehydrogenase (short-subunit alcohol dehydrogenase family)